MTEGTATTASRKTLYLIDGHAQFFRAYHAIRTGMQSPVTKEPTNLTFGFTGMLLKVLREYRPDYLAVAIDVAGDRETFRSVILPEYKANRSETPDDFRPQVERCLQLLAQMSIPVVGEEGVEADDVIATLVRRLRAEHPELDIRIVSKDKDLAQILDEHVELFDVHTDEAVGPADLFKTEGVKPEHVPDILALMGDTIDNIPGVPGIGPKTAAKLILEYGSVENLIEHLDEIKGKRRENLETYKDHLPRNLQLVRLRDDLDVDLDLDAARVDVTALPVDELVATFRQLGFTRHTDDLEALLRDRGGNGSSTDRATDAAVPAGLFPDFEVEPPRIERGDYHAVTTAATLRELVARSRDADAVAIDTETDGVRPMTARLCGIAIAIRTGEAWYVPVRSAGPEPHLDEATVLEELRPLLEDESVAKIGHNLKFDMNVLRRAGVRLGGVSFDTMIASYVVDATRPSHKLDVLALALLGHTSIALTDLIGKGKSQTTFDLVPLARATEYAGEDVDVTLALHEAFSGQLETLELTGLFEDVEMPLVEVLADVEFNGIRVDPDELERQRVKLAERIEELREQIRLHAPHEFNPDSPKQLAAALFNKATDDPPGLGLPVQKRGKTGPSTDQEVLEKLCLHPDVTSPLPELIVEHRQLTKLVGTYLIALGEAIDPETGRIHASFNQTVTATGRLSASDPNLQNIPIRTDVGREIRRAFVADAGNVLLTADYSQIELRLLAHLCGDPALIEAFHAGDDIHTEVASEVFGVPPEEVTAAQRNSAKMVNFGIVYGITPFGLARRLGGGTTNDEAARIIADYKRRFDRIEPFLAECVHAAESRGYVETILGRRRAIPQARARHPMQRALGERMAINTVVQGSAADLIKLAMIDLHRSLPDRFPDTRLVLQIHDELVFETPREQVERLERFVVERMRSAMDLKVELVVETAWSENWIDAK